MKIVMSQNGHPVIKYDGVYGISAVKKKISGDWELIERAKTLIRTHYDSKFAEAAIREIDEYENPKYMYGIAYFDGDEGPTECVSELYHSHGEATWHLYNDKNEDGEAKYCLAYSPYDYGAHVIKIIISTQCPECGADDVVFDGLEHTCWQCLHTWLEASY